MTDNPTIDMTSETEQSFLDDDVPNNGAPTADERYEAMLARYEENGWDTSGLSAPEGYDEGEDTSRAEKSIDGLATASYTAVDDALFRAIKRSAWWEEAEYRNGTALSKAPRIWTTDEQVPEVVRDAIERVIDSTNWRWEDFESLDPREADELVDLLEEKLTQPQGWSVESLSRDIEEEFGLDESVAVGVAADTSHSVLNGTREYAYEQMEGSEDFEYKWLNPLDHRTTPVCEEIIEEVEDRGGAVSLPTLKQILREKAVKYEGTHEGGGTPGRVDQWKPHYRCRSTFARQV